MHSLLTRRLSRRSLGGLMALGALPAHAQTGTQASQPVRGGTLVAVVTPEPPVLTNTINNHYTVSAISPNIYEGLLTYDERMRPLPGLAERWEVSADNLTITFHLRRGVKWHDGRDFTAEDVRYSALELWKKLHPRGRATFVHLTAVEVPDPLTAVFRLANPSPTLLTALSAAESQVLPAHLYAGTDPLTNPHNARPIGTGAFRFARWQKGDYIELARNEQYWDEGKPYLDRLIFRFIPDSASRAAAFENGEVHYGPYDPVPLADVGRLRQNPTLAIETVGYAWQSLFLFFEFNLRNPIARDLKVRQAVAHAINKQGLIDSVWYGLGKPAISPVPSYLTDFFTEEVPRYDLNLAKANALLDEAGYPRKAGGIRFSLTHEYDANSESWQNTAEYIRQNLRGVGIDLKLRTLDVAGMFRRVFTDYDYETRSGMFSSMLDPAMGLYRLYWSKSRIKGVPNTNASDYASDAMDRAIETTQNDANPAHRAAAFQEWQRIAMTDLPNIPLVELERFTLYNRRVHGLPKTPDAALSSLKGVWLSA